MKGMHLVALARCKLFATKTTELKERGSIFTFICLAERFTAIPHICHLLYTGRIFKFQILHLKITKIYPKKRKYVIFLRSIWKNLHLTDFFTRAAPVVPVTNMRYAYVVPPLKANMFLFCSNISQNSIN